MPVDGRVVPAAQALLPRRARAERMVDGRGRIRAEHAEEIEYHPSRGPAIVALESPHQEHDAKGHAYVAEAGYKLVFTLQPNAKNQKFRLVPIDSDTDIDSVAGIRASACRAFVASALRIFNKHNKSVPRIH